MKNNPELFEICYEPGMKNASVSGFKLIGDRNNSRPEWYEYWHIRGFLGSENLKPDTFYGFFSPKFGEKTGMTSVDVKTFAEQSSDSDIILFSPYLDQICFFLNIVEQGWFAHPELKKVFERIIERHFPNLDPEVFVSTTENTVFCNYFIAKGDFWYRWFEICEDFFHDIESRAFVYGVEAGGETRYKQTVAPLRTFVIERIATLLIISNAKWRVASAPSYMHRCGKMSISGETTSLLKLDALKKRWQQTRVSCYIEDFLDLRLEMLRRTMAPSLQTLANGPYKFHERYADHLRNRLASHTAC